MKLGKVGITTYYVVDIENPDMVVDAKACLAEDIINAVKHGELYEYIHITDDDGSLSENDIPEFLIDLDSEQLEEC